MMHFVFLALFVHRIHNKPKTLLNIGRIRCSRYLLLQRDVRFSFRSFLLTPRFVDGSFFRDDVGQLLPTGSQQLPVTKPGGNLAQEPSSGKRSK